MNKKITWTVTTISKDGKIIDREFFCTRNSAMVYKRTCAAWDKVSGYKRTIDRYLPESVR